MTKINYFKEAWIQVAFVTSLLLVTSCNMNRDPRESKGVSKENEDSRFESKSTKDDDSKFESKTQKNEDTRFESTIKKDDAQFLVQAAEINLAEIQLGKLAQQNGSSKDIRELGKMMEDTHTKSLNDLQRLAGSKNFTIPTTSTENAQDDYKKLNQKSGADFDKAYANMMVSKHEDAISAFQKASNDSEDIDIKNWATASLHNLHKHLEKSIEFKKECDKM